ncbi:MAG: hypothetical protein OdinLCB4_002690 [Candidatus Odinarchaeum yellowstonii]|uniref:Uncharacterized protein n=1 Tax=Odinarchaeota yellowstonii (strain LCB_4) TaxID=1841599 RepID=A0AAF0IBW8_ODILC|nr:MAG: hypothetical protein OdinLCB4_002690 [Candidatus Odinarchaeum yellowstonii]
MHISVINGVIEDFNKYRGSEIQAELISADSDKIEIKFSGPFCYTCGLIDYFEDFQLLLEDYTKIKFKVENYTQVDFDTYIVDYTPIQHE